MGRMDLHSIFLFITKFLHLYITSFLFLFWSIFTFETCQYPKEWKFIRMKVWNQYLIAPAVTKDVCYIIFLRNRGNFLYNVSFLIRRLLYWYLTYQAYVCWFTKKISGINMWTLFTKINVHIADRILLIEFSLTCLSLTFSRYITLLLSRLNWKLIAQISLLFDDN